MRHCAVLFVALLLAAGIQGQEKKQPSPTEPTEAEKTIVEIINKERAKEKLPPLKINPVLTKVARAHSENMGKTSTLEHVLDGKNPTARIKASGYRFVLCGENIAFTEGRYTPDEVVQGWMESKHHRENILDRRFTETGLGIATNSKGETYYTQVFATPAR